MKTKLHLPKYLNGIGKKPSFKQFILSLIATTVSIALTFGTAAIIDQHKKQKEKHEIVMMVMYDMFHSLQSVEKADSVIYQSMLLQRKLAEDPSLFHELRFQLGGLLPIADYTETTERIFSSSIETINTVGNVLFTECVAEFYQSRSHYKTMVCDSVYHAVMKYSPFTDLKSSLEFDYSWYAIFSSEIKHNMQQLFTQCKQMMAITDKEIYAYRKEREKMDASMYENDVSDSHINKYIQLQQEIEELRGKLKLE